MRVGWVGLGKLGFPVAHVQAQAGLEVFGTDANPQVEKWVEGIERYPHQEEGLEDLRRGRGGEGVKIRWRPSIREVVQAKPEVVFVAVQTPHAPQYDGTMVTQGGADFEYAYLVAAVREVVLQATAMEHFLTIAVVSTVLPGTTDRFLRPLLSHYTQLVYTPSFIAMGTVVQDYLKPEFWLVGTDLPGFASTVQEVFRRVNASSPVIQMSPTSAEMTKMAYNTFIGLKLVFANALMELCHKTGADVDDVTNALTWARDRLISGRYLKAGMGDGGGCHPRDQLALSWLANRVGLSFDLFGGVMEARTHQTNWLATMVAEWHARTELPITVLGKAYKPESKLEDGSPATLLWNLLRMGGVDAAHFDPITDLAEASEELSFLPLRQPGVFVIGTKHERFREIPFRPGSVVLDPWGYIPPREGVLTIRLGRTL